VKKSPGFTLVELLLCVALVGVLASMAMPLAELTVRRHQETELRRSLREIREAIDAYKRAADEGRIDRAADRTGYPESLSTLVEGARDKSHPEGPKIYFLRRIPRDPLAPDPRAPAEGTWALRAYASPADAPSSGADVYDVRSQSPRTGLNGVPYAQW
jgi:general secretion pathway protein G